jgi:hypothetical protein
MRVGIRSGDGLDRSGPRQFMDAGEWRHEIRAISLDETKSEGIPRSPRAPEIATTTISNTLGECPRLIGQHALIVQSVLARLPIELLQLTALSRAHSPIGVLNSDLLT